MLTGWVDHRLNQKSCSGLESYNVECSLMCSSQVGDLARIFKCLRFHIPQGVQGIRSGDIDRGGLGAAGALPKQMEPSSEISTLTCIQLPILDIFVL